MAGVWKDYFRLISDHTLSHGEVLFAVTIETITIKLRMFKANSEYQLRYRIYLKVAFLYVLTCVRLGHYQSVT